MPAHTAQQPADSLPGWVSAFYVTSGGKKSGPYHARCWKRNGKLKKEYIKAADLDRVRAACENHRQKRLRHTELSKQLATVSGNLNFLFRILKRSEKRNRIRQEETAHLHRIQSQGPPLPSVVVVEAGFEDFELFGMALGGAPGFNLI